MNSDRLTTSYLLLAVWLIGLGGLHRLYNGKIGTGLLWLFTGGLLGIGQFIDLFLVPGMVEEYELRLRGSAGYSPNSLPSNHPTLTVNATRPTRDQLMVKLLKAADARGGRLSVPQAVVATEANFAEVEAVFRDMLKSGYVSVHNDPDTGAVIYHFHDL